jgi:ATP-dependent helicase/nuclease subunit A
VKILDQAVRLKALEPGTNTLVEAGAGTGKTTLLVERAYVAIVEQHIRVSRLVLITFMDKAAAEMRARLREKLERAQNTGTPPEAERARRALRELRRAPITTIHGFCRMILERYAVGHGIPLPFMVMDAYDEERWWQKTFEHWLSTPAGSQLALQFSELGFSYAVLVKWARAISAWPRVPDFEAQAPEVDGTLARYRDQAQHLVRVARELAAPDDRGRAQIVAIASQLDRMLNVPDPQRLRLLGEWTTGLAPQGNQRGWASRDALRRQKAWIDELRAALQEIRQHIADFYLAQWLRAMRDDFLPQWQAVRWQAGLLTFNDLVWECERILRDETVRRDLERRFDLIMVDEFQDTDPIQVNILDALARAGPDRGRWRPGRVFLVGDPKQSIYRFRGADVETYVRVRQAIQDQGGQVLPIVQNFRSHPQILAHVNRLFAEWWPSEPDPEAPYIVPYQPLHAAYPDDGAQHVFLETVDGPDIGAQRRQEARRMVDIVRRAVQEGWPVRASDGRGMRPIGWQDIALVMPQRTGLSVYQEVFEQAGIALAAGMGRGFFQRDEVRGFQCLLQALYDPWDPVPLLGWLRSPWVGLSLEQLLEHRVHGGQWDYRVSTPGSEEVLSWYRRLAAWRRQTDWGPEDVLDQALAVTGLLERARAYDDAAMEANLMKLRDLTRDLGDRWGFSEFTRWLTDKVVSGAEEEEAPVARRAGQVAVSTVHQAKGLEWPMVVVGNWKMTDAGLADGVYLDVATGRVGLKAGAWQSRDFSWVDQQYQLRALHEAIRLRYVALTRARDYLVVFSPLA